MTLAPPLPVVLDTDIGDDVDDAFALALALRLPSLRVCGVTTVCGPVARRAQLAGALVALAGQAHIPVVAGSSRMSDGRPGSARLSQASLLPGAAPAGHHEQAQHPEAATALLVRCAREWAPLTIIGLGPLTNIAAALRAEPRLARWARLVAMGGKLGWPYPDWNLRCDPAAARAVLASGMPVTLVGMHVTMGSKLLPAQMRRLLGSSDALARWLGRCVLAWRTWRRRMPILHDALTVAVAADPTIATCEPRRMRVYRAGFSRATRRGPANVLVCTRVDLARFGVLLDRYLLDDAETRPPAGPLERLAFRIA
jgi:inosine-uridine nucleoside N-ribohydrolase